VRATRRQLDSQLILETLEKAQRKDARYLLGIVGYPGAGKSTTAGELAHRVNEIKGSEFAIVVPMDGFHLANEVLEERKLRHLKGIPETFDAAAFLDLLKRLKTSPPADIGCPLFDRSIEASIENGIVVKPVHKLIVIEGNYLLLDVAPWNEVRDILDECWFIDSTIDIVFPRLVKRHIEGGLTESGAKAKVDSTDLPNAHLIESTRKNADLILEIE